MSNDKAIAVADTLLTGAIQFLLQKQKVEALLTTARLENRQVSADELSVLKVDRDELVSEVNSLLDGIA